jgi:hypothetical protein
MTHGSCHSQKWPSPLHQHRPTTPANPPNVKHCPPHLASPNLESKLLSHDQYQSRPARPSAPNAALHAASQNDPSALTLLKRLHVTRGKRDPDLVDLGGGGAGLVELLVIVHGGGFGLGDVVVGGVARGETAT